MIRDWIREVLNRLGALPIREVGRRLRQFISQSWDSPLPLFALFLVYLPVLYFGGFADDFCEISGQSSRTWSFILTNWVHGHLGRYRPTCELFLFLVFKAFGKDFFWYHLALLSVHLGAVVSFYYAVRRMCLESFVGLSAASLLLLHPAVLPCAIRISANFVPFCLLFGCLALATCVREDGSWASGWRLGAAVLLFYLSGASAEPGLFFLAAAPPYYVACRIFRGQPFWPSAKRAVPASIAAVVGIIMLILLNRLFGGQTFLNLSNPDVFRKLTTVAYYLNRVFPFFQEPLPTDVILENLWWTPVWPATVGVILPSAIFTLLLAGKKRAWLMLGAIFWMAANILPLVSTYCCLRASYMVAPGACLFLVAAFIPPTRDKSSTQIARIITTVLLILMFRVFWTAMQDWRRVDWQNKQFIEFVKSLDRDTKIYTVGLVGEYQWAETLQYAVNIWVDGLATRTMKARPGLADLADAAEVARALRASEWRSKDRIVLWSWEKGYVDVTEAASAYAQRHKRLYPQDLRNEKGDSVGWWLPARHAAAFWRGHEIVGSFNLPGVTSGTVEVSILGKGGQRYGYPTRIAILLNGKELGLRDVPGPPQSDRSPLPDHWDFVPIAISGIARPGENRLVIRVITKGFEDASVPGLRVKYVDLSFPD